ncbi:MAG: transcriptional repressor NrdR [Alphaproteobacteria bacterium]|nr:transcriptional repressor NrdR [Alphaproteobacteria bacterium]
MRCPFCGHLDTSVKDSRGVEEDAVIRRRRYCTQCNARFTTVERVQLLPLNVVKKSGESIPFERDKLARSIYLALHKRPIEHEHVERMINSLVRQLETLGETEIPSSTIGEMVMSALQDLDTVAYVRFASVYHQFNRGKDFEAFVAELKGDNGDKPQDISEDLPQPDQTNHNKVE